MCFSAQASFIASAGLAVAGVATLRLAEPTDAGAASAPAARVSRVSRVSEWPLAAVPLLFALHQASEGMVWLNIDRAGEDFWAHVFAILAYCGWPIYLPLALYLHETDPLRRRLLQVLIGLGSAVALYFLYFMLDDTLRLRVTLDNLRYRFDYPFVIPAHIAYGVAVIGAPALSRSWLLRVFAAALFVAYLIAYYVWDRTHPSVWCYFASVLSVLVFMHFWLRYRSDARSTSST